MGDRVEEELVSTPKWVILVVILVILMFIMFTPVGNFIKNQFYSILVMVRKQLVELLKGRAFTTLYIFRADYGDPILEMLQKVLSGTPPETQDKIEKQDFGMCELKSGACTIGGTTITLEKTSEGGLFKFRNARISGVEQQRLVPEGEKRYSTNYDLMLDYSDANNPIAVEGVPSVLYKIFMNIKSCYDANYMKKEGDPFYKSKDPNPYLCARLEIKLDENVELSLSDLDTFMKTTWDDQGKYYSENFKPLQISYCFDTDTCIRTQTFMNIETNAYGKTCFPIESLEITDEDINLEKSLGGEFATVFGAIAGIAIFLGPPGWAVSAIAAGAGAAATIVTAGLSTEKITCETEKMEEDLSQTTINNKIMKILYWDDNGESTVTLAAVKSFRGTLVSECSNALIMSSKYYDYLGRQTDPLIICLTDLTEEELNE